MPVPFSIHRKHEDTVKRLSCRDKDYVYEKKEVIINHNANYYAQFSLCHSFGEPAAVYAHQLCRRKRGALTGCAVYSDNSHLCHRFGHSVHCIHLEHIWSCDYFGPDSDWRPGCYYHHLRVDDPFAQANGHQQSAFAAGCVQPE